MPRLTIPLGQLNEAVDTRAMPNGMLRTLANLWTRRAGGIESAPGWAALECLDESDTAIAESVLGVARFNNSETLLLTAGKLWRQYNDASVTTDVNFENVGPHSTISAPIKARIPRAAHPISTISYGDYFAAVYDDVDGDLKVSVFEKDSSGIAEYRLLSEDDVPVSGVATFDSKTVQLLRPDGEGIRVYVASSAGAYYSEYNTVTRSWGSASTPVGPTTVITCKFLLDSSDNVVLVYESAAGTLRGYLFSGATDWALFASGSTMVTTQASYNWDACITNTTGATECLVVVYEDTANDVRVRTFNLSTQAQIGTDYQFSTEQRSPMVCPRFDASNNGIFLVLYGKPGSSVVYSTNVYALTVSDAGSYTSILRLDGTSRTSLVPIGGLSQGEVGGCAMFAAANVNSLYGAAHLFRVFTPSTARVGVELQASFGRGAVFSEETQQEWSRQTIGWEGSVSVCAPLFTGEVAAGDDPTGCAVYVFDELAENRTGTGAGEHVEACGLLLAASGVVTAFDGEAAFALGFPSAPPLIGSLTPSGSGTLDGSYQYVAVFSWRDATGVEHLSAPSKPYSVNASSDGAIGILAIGRKGSDTTSGVFVKIYRTAASGVTFYEIEYPAPYTSGYPADEVQVNISDTTTDADLISRPILYTQGASGARGGQLAYSAPQGCRSIAVSPTRVLLGGLEEANEIQFSHEFFAGEPPVFSDSSALRARLPGTVIAVAWGSSIWYVFGRDRIWAISGQGPDVSGVGEFAPPADVQCPTGIAHPKALCESVVGVFFQGTDGAIYVIRQSSLVAEKIGLPIWFTMDSGFSVTSVTACNRSGVQCVVFEGTGSDEPRLVYDIEHGDWHRETHGPIVAVGGAVLGGIYSESYSFVGTYSGSAYVGYDSLPASEPSFGDDRPVALDTGRIYPFGQDGFGRIRSVTLLVSANRAGGELTIEDVDNSDTIVFDTVVGTALASGNPGVWERYEWKLPVQKRESIMLSISADKSTDEYRFHSISIDYETLPGNKRRS